MTEASAQMSGEKEAALALQREEEMALEMRGLMVSYFQGAEVVSCRLAAVDLSLKPTTEVDLH